MTKTTPQLEMSCDTYTKIIEIKGDNLNMRINGQNFKIHRDYNLPKLYIKYNKNLKRYVNTKTGRIVSKKDANRAIDEYLNDDIKDSIENLKSTRTPASSTEPKKLFKVDKSKRRVSPRRNAYQYHNEKPKWVIQILGYKDGNLVCDVPEDFQIGNLLGVIEMVEYGIMHGGISDD